MKLSFLGFLTLLCCASFGVFAANEVRDNMTGATFPSEVSFDFNGKSYHLQATGVATRKKLMFNVYSVCSYLQDGAYKPPADKISVIMQDDFAKQLTLKWQRKVDAEKVQEGYRESFKNVLSSSVANQLRNEIDTFIDLFNNEIQKGDIHALRWIPGGNLEVYINDNKVGSMTNKDFAKAVWSLWFSEKSAVDRTKLISLMK